MVNIKEVGLGAIVKMTEQAIQKAIIKYLKTISYVVKIISASKSGIPDLLVLYKGKFIALEVKTPNKKNNVSDLQEHNINEIIKNGGLAFVVWELNQVKEIIKGLEK